MKTRILTILFCVLSSAQLHAVEVEAKLGWADRQYYAFPVTGVVSALKVRVGDKVEKGQLLASLDSRPFQYRMQQCEARVKKAEPAVFDARLDLNHAEELFERSVLSEVELQRIDSRYKSLNAELDILRAECKVNRWEAQQASLTAREPSYVLSHTLVQGMVISTENQAQSRLELVSANEATATSWLSSQQKSQLKLSDKVEVDIDGQVFPAKVDSVELQANEAQLSRVVFVFYFKQPLQLGKTIKVRF